MDSTTECPARNLSINFSMLVSKIPRLSRKPTRSKRIKLIPGKQVQSHKGHAALIVNESIHQQEFYDLLGG